MSKIFTNNVNSGKWNQYDSISLGEQIFIEEMPRQSIPADYEKINDSVKRKKTELQKTSFKKDFNFDQLFNISIRLFALSALGFIILTLFSGVMENSTLTFQKFGREAGITLGIFISIAIVTVLLLFSKTRIKIYVENSYLHVKSYRGLNHVIPIENIAECKIDIFKKAHSIKTFVTSKKYKVDLEAGLLITFKDGKNLLIASSNSYQSNKNFAFSN